MYMRPQRASHPKTYLKLHREYKLYYFLAILYGTRKQIFMTFAPWVLVTIFKQPTQTMATLFMVGGIIGIVFQPILGNMIARARRCLLRDAPRPFGRRAGRCRG